MLQGLVAVVTGGASGLGKATVQRLIENGAKVAVIDLPNSTGGAFCDELGKDCLFTPVYDNFDKNILDKLFIN